MEGNKVVLNIVDINGEIDRELLQFQEDVIKSYCNFLGVEYKLLGAYEPNEISKKVYDLLG
jgi:hypothetical protein